ncbi:MAG: YjjG family noncanonical pyrimidine nucleotidase [Gemmiger sp.]|nr:YjjG family noncanonical pyrimidine nucleotidase [Gemmiger sp.]
MAKYTCVLMDADNTILDFAAAERQALVATLENFSVPCDEATCDTYRKVNRALWDGLAKGEITRSKLFAVRFGRFLQAAGLPDNGNSQKMNDYYEEQLSLHAELIPGAMEALYELAEVATIALVSNGSLKVQRPRIEASGIGRYLDGVFISEQVGAAKPSAKIFEVALRELGITDRQKVLVVGDDLQADIKGGQNAGIDTCWINFGAEENTQSIRPKYTVGSYEELYSIVMEPEELENVGSKNRRHMGEG